MAERTEADSRRWSAHTWHRARELARARERGSSDDERSAAAAIAAGPAGQEDVYCLVTSGEAGNRHDGGGAGPEGP